MAAIAAATISSFLGFGLPLLRKVVAQNMEEDVRRISSDMDYIRASFKDLSGSSADPDAVTEQWFKDMKLLAYDIEDFTDGFLSQFMPQASEDRGCFLRRVWRSLAIRIHIGQKIDKLGKRSRDVNNQFKDFKAANDKQKSVDASTEVPSHLTMEGEADVKSLRRLLLSSPSKSEKKLKVISIVGYGAQGNTLLVDKVYYNDKVCAEFPVRVRVDAAGKTLDQVLREIDKVSKKNNSGSSSNIVDHKGKGVQEIDQVERQEIVEDGVTISSGFSLAKPLGSYQKDRRIK